MPAYSVLTHIPNCSMVGCFNKGAYKVFNTFNGFVGEFCLKHANEIVERLNK